MPERVVAGRYVHRHPQLLVRSPIALLLQACSRGRAIARNVDELACARMLHEINARIIDAGEESGGIEPGQIRARGILFIPGRSSVHSPIGQQVVGEGNPVAHPHIKQMIIVRKKSRIGESIIGNLDAVIARHQNGYSGHITENIIFNDDVFGCPRVRAEPDRWRRNYTPAAFGRSR